VAFSPDSKYILSSSGDNTARLWRLPDQPAPENASTVFRKRWDAGTPNYGVDLSPDGRLLISMHGSGVKVWDVAAGKVVYDLPGFYAGFTVDGKQFVVAGKPDEQGDCLGVFDTDTGKLVRRFAKFKNHVIVLFVCPDGRTVLAGSDDRPNQLFDYTTGEQRPSGTEALGWTAIWGSKDMLDFKERTMVFPEYVLPGGTDVMGRNLVDERAIGIYQTSSGNLVRKVIVPGSGRINQIFTSARYGRRNGNRIAIALPDGTIHVMDLVSGKEVARFSAGNFTPKIMVISADDRFLAACASGEKSDVVVWRLPAQAKENP
jgi:WD40 repeat protein